MLLSGTFPSRHRRPEMDRFLWGWRATQLLFGGGTGGFQVRSLITIVHGG
jgi:hypothetical protein